MPVAVSLRFDDDVAATLRERAQLERRSINRIVNDAMRKHLAAATGALESESSDRARQRALIETLPDHFAMLAQAIKLLNHQETQADFNDKTRLALLAVKQFMEVLVTVIDPDSAPVVGETAREKALV